MATVNNDGSVTRAPFPISPPNPDSFVDGVSSNDSTLDASLGLWVRSFLPSLHSSARLPLLLFFHGGGFIMYSASAKLYHRFCHSLAKAAQVIVVSVEYRLAPEHRLPAAYDDAWTSLMWLRSHGLGQITQEPRLISHADFSHCILMGDSAGGNIVHNLSFRAANVDITPLHIRGQILLQPFFGGVDRTASELRMVDDKIVPLSGNDELWRLSLPKGTDRDHPYSNPWAPSAPSLIGVHMPRTLVMVGLLDPLQDRGLLYYQKLKALGIDIQLLTYPNGVHGFQFFNIPEAKTFMKELCSFIQSCVVSQSKL